MRHTATVLLTDCVNGNGRIYPLNVIEKAVEEYCVKVKDKKAFGVIGSGPSEEDSDPQPTDFSHLITDISISRDVVIVELVTLDTEAGKALEQLLKAGKMVFRTAGTGVLGEDNKISDYTLLYVFAQPKHLSTPLRHA